MQYLNKDNHRIVSGGNPVVIVGEAIAAGAGVFVAPIEIASALGHEGGYPAVGATLGEAIYNFVNPNPLGQMVFTPTDFGGSYIAPGPFIW